MGKKCCFRLRRRLWGGMKNKLRYKEANIWEANIWAAFNFIGQLLLIGVCFYWDKHEILITTFKEF